MVGGGGGLRFCGQGIEIGTLSLSFWPYFE
jgi:hypothetical protein